MNDPHGKKEAWRSLIWSFPYAILIIVAGLALLFGAHYVESPVMAFLGLAALVSGFLQPVGHALFDLFAAYIWRPLWQHVWFQWAATAVLAGLILLIGWSALISDWFQ